MNTEAAEVDRPEASAARPLRPIEIIERWFFGLVFVLLVVSTATPVLIRWLNALTGSSLNVPNSFSVLTPQLVLAIALFGASTASRDRKHIAIDVVGPFLKPRAKLFVRTATQALAGIVVLGVAPASFRFLGQEMERDSLSRFFDLPIWIEFLIVPIGLTLIAVRLLVAAAVDGFRAVKNEGLDSGGSGT